MILSFLKRLERSAHMLLLIGAMCISATTETTRAADTASGPEILQQLHQFQQMGSVLFVAAHPDDENTQLITYLARGRHYRTAYLSVTRGDGGQNLIGGELFEQLGVARTQELLAARQVDGGQQFFTRAKDFGFSKHVAETLRIWDNQVLIGDVVRIIRTFRPDVVITRFNPDTDNTHGHHTASAVLAREAFKVSGNANAYPEQLKEGLTPWQPKRIFMNGGGNQGSVIRVEIGGNDEVSGDSFGSIAGRSRAMHKTQGFDRGGRGGGAGGRGGGGNPAETFTLLAGEPATKDILDGVDTTWGRVSNGAEISTLTEQAITQFKPDAPAASVPMLLAIKAKVAALPADRIVNEKQRQLDRIIQDCIGLSVETTIPQVEVVPGESMKLHFAASIRSSALPVKWVAARYPKTGLKTDIGANLASASLERDTTQTLPVATLLTTPYWLREPGTVGLFRVDEAPLIGQPENPPAFPIEQVFDIGGQSIVISDEPMYVTTDSSKPQTRRRLDVIPPVSLHFVTDVRLFSPGSTRTVEVEAIAHRANTAGALQLDLPAGWKSEPPKQDFKLATVGQSAKLSFNVTAPAQAAKASIGAHAIVQGATYDRDRIEIRYNHIPPQLLQPRAEVKVVALDMKIQGKQVGYLQGAGDSVSECVEQMGYTVTQLTGADLNVDKLKTFDTVIFGIRSFETRTDIVPNIPALLAYVEGGGNLIIQYNRSDADANNRGKFGPFSLVQSGGRVTDENATMTFLAPDHPVLNTPNKITQADFDGWTQERGIYYPSQWDEIFTPIFAANDPGDPSLSGGLLVANIGKGHLVYTGLVFFRELPEGVPGAYRLFANLVSLGK